MWLKKIPTQTKIEETVDFIVNKGFFLPFTDAKLIDELVCVSNYLIIKTISKRNEGNAVIDNKWVEIFSDLKES